MTPVTFADLEAENARLRCALQDCNQGLNGMATKLTVVGELIGFGADEPLARIREVVIARLSI